MAQLDLPENWLAEIRVILNDHLPEEFDVFAYGSRMKGRAQPLSDLDLTVRHKHSPEMEYSELPTLLAAFRESNLPIIVQVQDWARIPEKFREEIKKNMKALKTKPDRG